MAGAWTVRIGIGDDLLAAGLLVLAGADHDLIELWVDVGRQRAAGRALPGRLTLLSASPRAGLTPFTAGIAEQ